MISPWFVLDGSNNGPSSGSLLVLASRLSTRMLPCWSTLDFYIIATHLQPMVIPTPGPFLVRASRLLYENMAYRWWISWTSFASLLQCNSRRERRPLATTPRFPRPSHLHGWRTDQGTRISLSPSSPRVLRSLTGSLAVRNPSLSSLRDPLLVCLLLVLLSQYLPSRVSPPIRYGWYCGWRRCSKVPVSSPFFGSQLDSPFFVL